MGAGESKRPDVPPRLQISEAEVKRLFVVELRKKQNEAIIAAQRQLQEEAASIHAQRKLQEEAFSTAQRTLQEEAASLGAQRKLQEEKFIATKRKLQEEFLIAAQRTFQEKFIFTAQRKPLEEQPKRALQEEAARTKNQEEAFETAFQEQAAKKTQQEAAERKQQEEATKRVFQEVAAKKKQQEEAVKIAFQEVAAKKKQQEEAAKIAFQEVAAKKKQQEEAAKIAFQEVAAKKKQQEEATKRVFQEEAAKKNQQEEAAKIAFQEVAAKKKQQEEATKRVFQEVAAKKKQQEEAAKIAFQEVAAKKKQQEEAARRAFQEEAAKKKQQEEDAKRAFQEVAAKKKQQEELAKRKQQEELVKRKQQEEAAKRKQQEEAAKRKQQEEAAKRKQQEEAAKRKQQEEADKRKQQEEADKRKQQEEAANRAFQEATKRKQEAEMGSFQKAAATRIDVLSREHVFCSTCYRKTTMKMFKCENGHGSCIYCKNIGRKCGICRSNLTNWRSYDIENQFAQTRVPCPHAWQGCVLHIKIADMENHVQECPFKQQVCPLAAFENCRWFGEISELSSHFADMHPNFLHTKADSEFHVGNIHRNHRYICLVKLDYHFIFHQKISKNDSKIYMAVQLIGTKMSAKKWLYEIHVYNQSENRKKYKYTDTCRSSIDDIDDVFSSGECAVLPLSYANTFVNDGALTYKFFIKRTYEGNRGFDRNQCGRDYSEVEDIVIPSLLDIGRNRYWLDERDIPQPPQGWVNSRRGRGNYFKRTYEGRTRGFDRTQRSRDYSEVEEEDNGRNGYWLDERDIPQPPQGWVNSRRGRGNYFKPTFSNEY